MKRTIVHELAVFAGLLCVGYLVLPAAIYAVGSFVFGDFADGFSGFFGALTRRLADGVGGAWFLILSPYFGVQSLRLGWYALRRTRTEP